MGPTHAALHEKNSQNSGRDTQTLPVQATPPQVLVGAPPLCGSKDTMNTAGAPKIIHHWDLWERAGGSKAGSIWGGKICVPSDSDSESSDPFSIKLPHASKSLRGPCYISQYNILIDAHDRALDQMKAIKGHDFIPTRPVFEAHLNVNAANALVDEAYVKVLSAKTDIDDFVTYLKLIQTVEVCELEQFGDTGHTSGAVLAAHPAIFRKSKEACEKAGQSILEYKFSERGAGILEACDKLPATTTTTTTASGPTATTTTTSGSTTTATTTTTTAPEPDVVLAPRAQASAEELEEAKAAQAAACVDAQDNEACMGVISSFQYPPITQVSIQFQECMIAKCFRTSLDEGAITVVDYLVMVSPYIERIGACAHLASGDASWGDHFSSPAGSSFSSPGYRKIEGFFPEGSPADQFADYLMATADPLVEQIQIKPEWPFLKCIVEVFQETMVDLGGGQSVAWTKKHIAVILSIAESFEPTTKISMQFFPTMRECHDPAVAEQEQEYLKTLGGGASIFRRALHALDIAHTLYWAS